MKTMNKANIKAGYVEWNMFEMKKGIYNLEN